MSWLSTAEKLRSRPANEDTRGLRPASPRMVGVRSTWLASPGTTRALERLGYRYTTAHTGVRDLRSGGWHPALALSHRPGGFGERAGARLMVAAARHAARRGADIRIALHPADLDRPGLREAALRAIDACLERGATPVTYLAALAGTP